MIFIAKVRRSLLLVGCTIWLHSTSAMHTNELKPVEDLTAKTGALLGDPLCQPSSTIEASMEKISSKASTERTSNYEQSEKKKAASGKGILNPNSECFWPPTYPKHFTEAYRSLPPNPPPQLRISFTEWHPVFDNEEDATRWYSYIRFYNLPSHAGFTLESIGHRTPSQEFWNHVARQNLNLGAPKMAPPPEPTGWLGVFHGIEDYQNWVAVGQHYVYSEQVEYSPFLVTPLVAPQKTNTQLGIRLEASDHRHSVGFVPLVIWSTIPRGSPNNPARPAEELILPEGGPLYKTSRLEESRIKEERIQKWSQTESTEFQEILSKVFQEKQRYYSKFWDVNPAPSYPPTTKDSSRVGMTSSSLRNTDGWRQGPQQQEHKPSANNVGPNYIHFRPQIRPAYQAQPMKPTFESYGQTAKEQYSSVHFQAPNVQESQFQTSMLKSAYSLEMLSRDLPQISATASNCAQDSWEAILASKKDLEMAHNLISKAMESIEAFCNQVCKLKAKDLGLGESGEFNHVSMSDEKMRPITAISSPKHPMLQISESVAPDLSQTSATLAQKPAASHLSSSQTILEGTLNTWNKNPTYLEESSEIPVSGELNQPEINGKESRMQKEPFRYAPKSSHIFPNFLSPTHGKVKTSTEPLIFGCEISGSIVKLRETESKDATKPEIAQDKVNSPPVIDTRPPHLDGGSLEANNSPSMLNFNPVVEKTEAKGKQWQKFAKEDETYQHQNKKTDQKSVVKNLTTFENPTVTEPMQKESSSSSIVKLPETETKDTTRTEAAQEKVNLPPVIDTGPPHVDGGSLEAKDSPSALDSHPTAGKPKVKVKQWRKIVKEDGNHQIKNTKTYQESMVKKSTSHENPTITKPSHFLKDQQEVAKGVGLPTSSNSEIGRISEELKENQYLSPKSLEVLRVGDDGLVQSHKSPDHITSPKKDPDNQVPSLFEVQNGVETSTGAPTQEIKGTEPEKDILGSHDNNEMNTFKDRSLETQIYKEEQLVDNEKGSLPQDDPPQTFFETHEKGAKEQQSPLTKTKLQGKSSTSTPQDNANRFSRQEERDRREIERNTDPLEDSKSINIAPSELSRHIHPLDDNSIKSEDTGSQIEDKKMNQESMLQKSRSFENPPLRETQFAEDHQGLSMAVGRPISSNSHMRPFPEKLKANKYLSPNKFDALTVIDDELDNANSPTQAESNTGLSKSKKKKLRKLKRKEMRKLQEDDSGGTTHDNTFEELGATNQNSQDSSQNIEKANYFPEQQVEDLNSLPRKEEHNLSPDSLLEKIEMKHQKAQMLTENHPDFKLKGKEVKLNQEPGEDTELSLFNWLELYTGPIKQTDAALSEAFLYNGAQRSILEIVCLLLKSEDKSQGLAINFDERTIMNIAKLKMNMEKFHQKFEVGLQYFSSNFQGNEGLGRVRAWRSQSDQLLTSKLCSSKEFNNVSQNIAEIYCLKEKFPVFYDSTNKDWEDAQNLVSTMKPSDKTSLRPFLDSTEIHSRLYTIKTVAENLKTKGLWQELELKELKKQGGNVAQLLEVARLMDLAEGESHWDHMSEEDLLERAIKLSEKLNQAFVKDGKVYIISINEDWYNSLQRANILRDKKLKTLFDQRFQKLIKGSKGFVQKYSAWTEIPYYISTSDHSSLSELPLSFSEVLAVTYVGLPLRTYAESQLPGRSLVTPCPTVKEKFQMVNKMLGAVNLDFQEAKSIHSNKGFIIRARIMVCNTYAVIKGIQF
ncbi:hypothetical protein CROQUDRAFT_700459 [Cronartium quercuum f. sp. fusiforme G11]|uniref:Uncharacterized protein n=1 Tax=Cronartium quercuum f. sp. fusiforme G11 TaxID=708437 RepID=A0A9P6NMZ8_9BASI|nr:hypothetical protein CROQUDRAFT_700459 [Cronartium quercuum f. sp. fusiforme G11]